MKTTKVVLKVHPKNPDGSNKRILVTEQQAKHLASMRNNTDERSLMVRLDKFYFSPMDIAYMEEIDIETYDTPKYLKQRIEEEKNGLVKAEEVYGE